MRLSVSTELDAPADVVWETLQKTALLRYVTWPLLGFEGDLPKRWRDASSGPGGAGIRIERLLLLGVVPLWEHEIWVTELDDAARTVLTRERGGPVETWEHRIRVEPLPNARCRYTDEVEIEAGNLTPLVFAFANLFYRYRQARWRSLARVLG